MTTKYSYLLELLGIQNDALTNSEVTIGDSVKDGSLKDFIGQIYPENKLILEEVKLESADAANQTILLNGTAEFLNAPHLHTTARFWVDEEENIQIRVSYQLPNQKNSARKWKFSDSFKDLPLVRKKGSGSVGNLLDQFDFFNSSFVVSSTNEDTSDTQLSRGISFKSQLNPTGIMDWVGSFFGEGQILEVDGVIEFPTLTLDQFKKAYNKIDAVQLYPWDLPAYEDGMLPGILLKAGLSGEKSIKDICSFNGEDIYIYTPLNNDWVILDMNPCLFPSVNYEGVATFGKSNKKINMILGIPGDSDCLNLATYSPDLTLDSLSALSDILGGGFDSSTHLPQLSELEKISEIQLLSFSILIDYAKSISFPQTTLTCALPNLKPSFLDGKLKLDHITMEIRVSNPAGGKTETYVTIYGTMVYDQIESMVEANFTAALRMGPIRGWVISSTIRAGGKGLALATLVEHLAESSGAALPAEVPDVYLSSLSLNYHSRSRTLKISARTDWVIPNDIPIMGGTDNQIFLQLTVTRDLEQGGKKALIDIAWTLEKNHYQLSANARISKQNQAYAVDFTVPDPGKPVMLSQLTEEVGLPDLPQPAESFLDKVFQVSHFSLDYDRQEKHFATSWSRPLPKVGGLLTIGYDQRKDVGVRRRRRVDVRWLAQQEDETIGIDDLLDLLDMGDGLDTLVDWADTVGLGSIVEKVREMLTFRRLGFSWEEAGGDDVITVAAISQFPQGNAGRLGQRSNGTKAFVALNRGKIRGVVAGVSLIEEPAPTGEGAAPSEKKRELILPDFLPSGVHSLLETARKVLDCVTITHLLISTHNVRSFKPPAHASDRLQPSHDAQRLPPGNPFGDSFVTLGRGIAIGIRVNVASVELLKKIVHLDELEGYLSIGKEIGLQCTIPGMLSLEAGKGNKIELSQPQVHVKAGAMGGELDLSGALDIHLFNQILTFQGWVSISPEALLGHIRVEHLPDEIPISCPNLPGVQFTVDKENPLYGQLGYQFEPPGVDVGFSGSFNICSACGPEHDFHGRVTFVLEIIDVVPQPLYVAFEMDRLNLATILEARFGINFYMRQAEAVLHKAEDAAHAVGNLAHAVGDADSGGDVVDEIGDVADVAGDAAHLAGEGLHAVQGVMGHIEAIVGAVELEDPSFHWADSIVPLPDGSTALPGVGFRGKLSIFGWQAFAMLEISAQGLPGISGHFETEPFDLLGVVKLSGDGKGICHKPRTAEEITKESGPPPDGKWYLEPGGPVLHLSTRASPFLHASLHAELFGLLHAGVHADITEDGFEFDLEVGSGSGDNAVSAHFNCHWWKQEGRFEASGDIGIHLKGTIGPLLGIPGTEFHLDTGLDGHAELTVDSKDFCFVLGGDFEFEGARLSIPELTIDVAFSDVAELVDQVWEHIKDVAEEIFVDFLAPVGKVIAEGAEIVADVAVEAAKKVGEVASEAAVAAEEVAKRSTALVKAGLSEAGEAVKDLKGEAAGIVDGAARKAEDFAKPLLAAADKLADDVTELAKKTLETVNALADAADMALKQALNYAGQVASEVMHEVTELLDNARRAVQHLIADAHALVNEIEENARRIVADLERKIGQLVDEIDELARRLEHLLEDIEHAAKSVWHGITHPHISLW